MIVAIDAELADLIPRYLDNRWADLVFARELVDRHDFVMVAALAHRLKGNAASYGLAALSRIALELEHAAHACDADAVAAILSTYEAFLRSLEIEYV